MSVVRSKKVVDLRLARPEWTKHNLCLWQTASDRCAGSWGMRRDAIGLRNETHLQAKWDKYHNDIRLKDRILLIEKWLAVLEESRKNALNERKLLANCKDAVETFLESLGLNLSINAECNFIRDGRQGYELVQDEADTELKKELDLIESIKSMLQGRCQEAWEQDCKLGEELHQLDMDISDKDSAINIDTYSLNLVPESPSVSFKPDPLRVPSKSVSPICWEEATRLTKQRIDTEAATAERLRGLLAIAKEKAINDINAQTEATNYALRLAVHETQKALNEMEWQRRKLNDEMAKAMKEIEALEKAIRDKEGPLKVAETRLEERTNRLGGELCRDEPQHGLSEEVVRLRQAIQLIKGKMDQAKAAYNSMGDQLRKIEADIADKEHAVETDSRCLDIRGILKKEVCPPSNEDSTTQTERNMKLFKIDKELPPW